MCELSAYKSHELTFYPNQNMSVIPQNPGLSVFIFQFHLKVTELFTFYLFFERANKKIINKYLYIENWPYVYNITKNAFNIIAFWNCFAVSKKKIPVIFLSFFSYLICTFLHLVTNNICNIFNIC